MTLDEKLDIFYNSSIEKATSQSLEMIREYTESLKKLYEEHMEESKRKAEVTLKVETENLIREKNRHLSAKALDIRREFIEKTMVLKEQLFQEVEEKLSAFMKTPAYTELLERRINQAVSLSRGDKITCYINPSDAEKKDSLERKTNVVLTISKIEFMGGIRAVIPSRNILIDYSFITKLAEAKETCTLN